MIKLGLEGHLKQKAKAVTGNYVDANGNSFYIGAGTNNRQYLKHTLNTVSYTIAGILYSRDSQTIHIKMIVKNGTVAECEIGLPTKENKDLEAGLIGEKGMIVLDWITRDAIVHFVSIDEEGKFYVYIEGFGYNTSEAGLEIKSDSPHGFILPSTIKLDDFVPEQEVLDNILNA